MRIRTEHDSCDLNSLELLDLDGPKYEPQTDTMNRFAVLAIERMRP
jgi:hypothetical protein